ncbi:hypothetical protein DFH09DRAFT_1410730 [Mycena vulgaris]|nr:hypothetical protein DFH09DRAFT_1410730 [Mycena vulgaris]
MDGDGIVMEPDLHWDLSLTEARRCSDMKEWEEEFELRRQSPRVDPTLTPNIHAHKPLRPLGPFNSTVSSCPISLRRSDYRGPPPYCSRHPGPKGRYRPMRRLPFSTGLLSWRGHEYDALVHLGAPCNKPQLVGIRILTRFVPSLQPNISLPQFLKFQPAEPPPAYDVIVEIFPYPVCQRTVPLQLCTSRDGHATHPVRGGADRRREGVADDAHRGQLVEVIRGYAGPPLQVRLTRLRGEKANLPRMAFVVLFGTEGVTPPEEIAKARHAAYYDAVWHLVPPERLLELEVTGSPGRKRRRRRSRGSTTQFHPLTAVKRPTLLLGLVPKLVAPYLLWLPQQQYWCMFETWGRDSYEVHLHVLIAAPLLLGLAPKLVAPSLAVVAAAAMLVHVRNVGKGRGKLIPSFDKYLSHWILTRIGDPALKFNRQVHIGFGTSCSFPYTFRVPTVKNATANLNKRVRVSCSGDFLCPARYLTIVIRKITAIQSLSNYGVVLKATLTMANLKLWHDGHDACRRIRPVPTLKEYYECYTSWYC